MSSYYFMNQNPNPTISSPSSSSSISSTTFNNNNSKTNPKNKNKTKNKTVMRLSTDPQSIAARERRHRISDRFKILQGLVPGGSKLDTVSMLDEAIQYVKFLKAQITLHQSLQGRGVGVVDDQNALVGQCGNYGVGFGCEGGGGGDFFAQMELPEGYFHFQGQECNFVPQYFEY